MGYSPKDIEPKWQKKWREEGIYEPDLDKAPKPFYNLMMFPYPSAEGLHVGNVYAFTGSDIYGRMKRMQGYDVFEPIGLDGFGIHSENYAMKIGAHPMDQALVSEERFYGQLEKIGNGFAWKERLETYKPEYYRWTQWIFAEMFRRGLAYRKKQSVNWCPKDMTVLADEQVENGKCERCGTEVVKKDLEQWFFKITAYADRLLANIPALDWSEKVNIAQTNWIGKSEGAEIEFAIRNSQSKVKVFTTRPDTLFGATFLVISPELAKKWMDEGWEAPANVKKYVNESLTRSDVERSTDNIKEKTGEFTGKLVINPVNQKEIPVWIADYVLGSYGTGAIMAVPAHDERDFQFAKKFNLPIVCVLSQVGQGELGTIVEGMEKTEIKLEVPFKGEGILVNSGDEFNGMDSETAKWEITKFVGGERKTQFRLRDWSIGRQRYWGPPIPMIFCDACAGKGEGERKEMPGWYAVADKDLPVILPRIINFRPTGSGTSPLATEKSFYEVPCPKCGSKARRETDIIDNFVDSAWYYLDYLVVGDRQSKNAEHQLFPLRDEIVKQWLPVNMYIGGAEHSVLHLLYVRFIAMALHDWGTVPFEEPIKKFRAHGLLIKDGMKMSKSKGNVVNPDEYIANFGADTLRMYLMFLAPFEQGGDFRDSGALGVERFLKRVWGFATGHWPLATGVAIKEDQSSLQVLLHKTIKKVTEDIENLHYNTSVSALMILLREFEETMPVASGQSPVAFETFLKILAPFAPHITEEIWRETLGHISSIHREPWPSYDPALIKEETFMLVFQVNGKTRDTMQVSSGVTEDEAKANALANQKVKQIIGNATPRKIVYVKERLVNIVT